MAATVGQVPSWPYGKVTVEHSLPDGDANAASLYERIVGGFSATLFSCTYVLVPLAFLSLPFLLYFKPFSMTTAAVAAPLIISTLVPPIPSRTILQIWPFKHMPKYFNYSEIKEFGDAQIQELIGRRAVLFCVQPHGVFSFGGCCAGVTWAQRWWHPRSIPTAVAPSVIRVPLIKHIVGLFGVCDAAPKPMARRLEAKKSCVLYIGGIAELFLTSGRDEKIFAKKRKGFVKLALRSGAEIVPVYFFGNTSVLSVLTSAGLRAFARATGVTLTWFWGWRGTIVPRPNKILGVLGTPLGLPATPTPEPTQEQIDEWHARYLAEVQRLFDTYKVFNPDYKDKELVFD